jgi:hypothetical protein
MYLMAVVAWNDITRYFLSKTNEVRLMIKKISYTLIPACMTLSVAMAGPLTSSLMSLSSDQMEQTTAGLSDNLVAGLTGGWNSGLSGSAADASGQIQAAAVGPGTVVAPTADISGPNVYSQQHNAYLVTMVATGLNVNVAPRTIAGSDFPASTRVNVEPMTQATGGGNTALSGGVAVASGQIQAAAVSPGPVTATIVVPTAGTSGQQLQADISGLNMYSQQYIANMVGRLGQINASSVIAASVPTDPPF